MGRVNLSGAQPTDVAGRAAYRVTVSPKHDGGLLGSAQLAWDATEGVPLQFAIYARGNTTPVLELKATSISYGSVPASDFNISPPAGPRSCGSGPAAAAATGADAARVHRRVGDRRAGGRGRGAVQARRARHRWSGCRASG